MVEHLGVWSVMSMPTSAIACDGDGVDLVGGRGSGGADLDAVAGEVAQQAGGHLGAAGVVDADEQHAGLVGHRRLLLSIVGCVSGRMVRATTSSAAVPASG